MSTAHFSITGEFITQHVRNLVLEDNHILAIKTLQTLEGLPIDGIHNILTGDMKLVGTNDLEDRPDDDKKYKNDLRWKYGGIVQHNHRFYRPYAVVNSYGMRDMTFLRDTLIAHKEFLLRSMFYADDKVTDIVKSVNVGDHKLSKNFFGVKPCLFKKVDNIPDFIALKITNIEDFQKAYDDSITAGRNIEIRG